MLKKLLKKVLRKSRTFRLAIDEYVQQRKADRWELRWQRYFAAGGTIRNEPKKNY